MKSILIIETPATCTDCPCYDYIHGVCANTHKGCELRKQAKPSWCPLRPLPQKKEETLNDIREMIDMMPTVDAVPVVRCKDCVYCSPIFAFCKYNGRCEAVNYDDFCSWGKENEISTSDCYTEELS